MSRAAQIEAIGAARKSLDGYIDEIWNTTILSAVYPLIEAEVRERVALEIEAVVIVNRRLGESQEDFGFRVAIVNQAIAIARGKENSAE
jgi:hypothetical protein